jgi:hypothetical protein
MLIYTLLSSKHDPGDYTAVRCGMNISKAIIDGIIDAEIEFENNEFLQLLCVVEGETRNVRQAKTRFIMI